MTTEPEERIMPGNTIWPKNTKVRPAMQTEIGEAARTLARLCIRAGIDLDYFDRDGLTVTVDRAKKLKKGRKPHRGGNDQ